MQISVRETRSQQIKVDRKFYYPCETWYNPSWFQQRYCLCHTLKLWSLHNALKLSSLQYSLEYSVAISLFHTTCAVYTQHCPHPTPSSNVDLASFSCMPRRQSGKQSMCVDGPTPKDKIDREGVANVYGGTCLAFESLWSWGSFLHMMYYSTPWYQDKDFAI